MASNSGPSDVEIAAEFDRLVRLARASGLVADWSLRVSSSRDTGAKEPWAILEGDLVLLVLGFTRGGAMTALRHTSWVFETFLTGDMRDDE